MADLTWQFTENPADEEEGPNDAGIMTFTKNPLSNLIRETIQNSLDAGTNFDPVKIDYQIESVPGNLFNAEHLKKALRNAANSAHNTDDGRQKFNRALRILESTSTVPTLCIRDSNTTGAKDQSQYRNVTTPWHSLTKSSGTPNKPTKDAAGSFGLGKHAAFAVTDLRTVLYSTSYRDQEDRLQMRFIGKTILVSHVDDERTQRHSKGYLTSDPVKYESTRSEHDIPRVFTLTQPGTGVFIPGYQIGNQGMATWRQSVIDTAIESYFHSIIQNKLVLSVDSHEINAENVAGRYQGKGQRTRNFIALSQSRPNHRTHIPGIGNVNLRVNTHEDPTSKAREIALVRDAGMMITDKPTNMRINLGRIPQQWRGFTAIIECLSDENQSSFIRQSESPRHDELSIDYVAADDQKQAAATSLRNLGSWVRQHIEFEAAPPQTKADNEITELVPYLSIPDEDNDANKSGHYNAGPPQRVDITHPIQSKSPSGGAGAAPGEHGRRRRSRKRTNKPNGGGSEPGRRGGGQGTTGTGNRARPVVIRNARVRPSSPDATHSMLISFDNPNRDAHNIQLKTVGEDGAEYPIGIREAKVDGEPITAVNDTLAFLPKREGNRYTVEISTREPIIGKTFRLAQR